MTGKQRREQLLDIGRSLFAERGFEGTSVEEIAATAGVSKPVVYEHFGGKEGLYAVVVDREIQTLLDTMTRSLTSQIGSRQILEEAALALLSFGESWHNLHHADPTCARHGVLRGQIDSSARTIWIFEKLGWATNVRWPDRQRLAMRRVEAA